MIRRIKESAVVQNVWKPTTLQVDGAGNLIFRFPKDVIEARKHGFTTVKLAYNFTRDLVVAFNIYTFESDERRVCVLSSDYKERQSTKTLKALYTINPTEITVDNILKIHNIYNK